VTGFLVPERSALIVVDMQAGFVGPHTAHVPGRVLKFLDQRSGEFDTVIATRFVNAPNSLHRRVLGWHEMSGSPDTELVGGLGSHCVEVVDKFGYSAAV